MQNVKEIEGIANRQSETESFLKVVALWKGPEIRQTPCDDIQIERAMKD